MPSRPRVPCQRALRVSRREEPSRRTRKCKEEGVALGIDFDARPCRKSAAKNSAMGCEHIYVGVPERVQ
jgi:hypothetical protein